MVVLPQVALHPLGVFQRHLERGRLVFEIRPS